MINLLITVLGGLLLIGGFYAMSFGFSTPPNLSFFTVGICSSVLGFILMVIFGSRIDFSKKGTEAPKTRSGALKTVQKEIKNEKAEKVGKTIKPVPEAVKDGSKTAKKDHPEKFGDTGKEISDVHKAETKVPETKPIKSEVDRSEGLKTSRKMEKETKGERVSLLRRILPKKTASDRSNKPSTSKTEAAPEETTTKTEPVKTAKMGSVDVKSARSGSVAEPIKPEVEPIKPESPEPTVKTAETKPETAKQIKPIKKSAVKNAGAGDSTKRVADNGGGETKRPPMQSVLKKPDARKHGVLDNFRHPTDEDEEFVKKRLERLKEKSKESTKEVEGILDERLDSFKGKVGKLKPESQESNIIWSFDAGNVKETLTETLSKAQKRVLIMYPWIRNMDAATLKKFIDTETRMIIQEASLDDDASVELIKLLMDNNVKIRTMPSVHTVAVVADDKSGLIISTDPIYESSEVGVVYKDQKSIGEIEKLFEDAWNISKDINLETKE